MGTCVSEKSVCMYKGVCAVALGKRAGLEWPRVSDLLVYLAVIVEPGMPLSAVETTC